MSSARSRTPPRPSRSSPVPRWPRRPVQLSRSGRERPRGSDRHRSAAQPCAQLLHCLGVDVVVRPEALALGPDDAGLAQDLEVMRDGGLREIEEWDELADADLAGVLAENVDELHADRISERLRHRRHPLGLGALDVRVDNRLATGLADRTLLLRRELQIERHLYTYID